MIKQWKSDITKQAMAECLEEKMSIYSAAKEYNVPPTSLSQHVRGNVAVDVPAGHQASSADEENSLVNYLYIKHMHTVQLPVDRSQVISIAWAIDLKRKNIERHTVQTIVT